VAWGDPAAALAIVVAFSFVAAGAALLVGAVARNASQAGAIGPALGMGLGLIGILLLWRSVGTFDMSETFRAAQAGEIDQAELLGKRLRVYAERLNHKLGLAWADAGDALVTVKQFGYKLVDPQ